MQGTRPTQCIIVPAHQLREWMRAPQPLPRWPITLSILSSSRLSRTWYRRCWRSEGHLRSGAPTRRDVGWMNDRRCIAARVLFPGMPCLTLGLAADEQGTAARSSAVIEYELSGPNLDRARQTRWKTLHPRVEDHRVRRAGLPRIGHVGAGDSGRLSRSDAGRHSRLPRVRCRSGTEARVVRRVVKLLSVRKLSHRFAKRRRRRRGTLRHLGLTDAAAGCTIPGHGTKLGRARLGSGCGHAQVLVSRTSPERGQSGQARRTLDQAELNLARRFPGVDGEGTIGRRTAQAGRSVAIPPSRSYWVALGAWSILSTGPDGRGRRTAMEMGKCLWSGHRGFRLTRHEAVIRPQSLT